jgi:hypothetical protein
MDWRSLLPRLSVGFRIGLVDRRTDGLEHEVELVVRRVEVVHDALQGRRSLDVVANRQEKAMRDIHEDRDFVEVVCDR